MNRYIYPILFTIVLVMLVLGGYLVGRQKAWFIHKSAQDINLYRNWAGDTLYLSRKDLTYGITGWRVTCNDDKIMHLDLMLNKNGSNNKIQIHIDTFSIHYLEIYEKKVPIKEIAISE